MHRHAARRRMRLADSAELCRDATSTWIAFRRHSGKVVKCAAMLAIVPTCAGAAGVLDPQGPVGSAEKLILINSLAIMLPIVIPTILATLGFAWWSAHRTPKRPISLPSCIRVASNSLEVAVHLPRRENCHGQSARRSCGDAHPFLAHLGIGDERFLRPATGQHDLHDERNDDAIEFAGR